MHGAPSLRFRVCVHAGGKADGAGVRVDEVAACRRESSERVQRVEVRFVRVEAAKQLGLGVEPEDLESVVVESRLGPDVLREVFAPPGESAFRWRAPVGVERERAANFVNDAYADVVGARIPRKAARPIPRHAATSRRSSAARMWLQVPR